MPKSELLLPQEQEISYDALQRFCFVVQTEDISNALSGPFMHHFNPAPIMDVDRSVDLWKSPLELWILAHPSCWNHVRTFRKRKTRCVALFPILSANKGFVSSWTVGGNAQQKGVVTLSGWPGNVTIMPDDALDSPKALLWNCRGSPTVMTSFLCCAGSDISVLGTSITLPLQSRCPHLIPVTKLYLATLVYIVLRIL